MFREYIEAFNSGSGADYARFYASDAILTNGAGDKLHGPAAIVEFYDELKKYAKRRIEVLGLIEGRDTLSAALQSTFEVTSDGFSFAGQILDAGDRVLLRSFALYELEGDKFKRIQAQTLDRKILRAGLPGKGEEAAAD
jgi:ketosteroid isomerase-like protein